MIEDIDSSRGSMFSYIKTQYSKRKKKSSTHNLDSRPKLPLSMEKLMVCH